MLQKADMPFIKLELKKKSMQVFTSIIYSSCPIEYKTSCCSRLCLCHSRKIMYIHIGNARLIIKDFKKLKKKPKGIKVLVYIARKPSVYVTF